MPMCLFKVLFKILVAAVWCLRLRHVHLGNLFEHIDVCAEAVELRVWSECRTWKA